MTPDHGDGLRARLEAAEDALVFAQQDARDYLHLLELSIGKTVRVQALLPLLRNHQDRHSGYALACRDIAQLLHDALEDPK